MQQKNTPSPLSLIVQPLLTWYDQQARVLPWREHPAPYRVWISEIMLQQTRVETVKPYFERFLNSLPDIESLAAADEQTLLKLWEGLGYYSRVRNLQKAARVIMEEYAGQIPSDVSSLQKLPGIGPYTAGAIASIAYGAPAPAVDGNVLRVISRITASRDDITSSKVKKQMGTAITEILPKDRVGDFNQALMELGAMVCLPNGVAKCPDCPVRSICRAHEQGIVMELPVKPQKKLRKIEPRTVLVLFSGSTVALRRRPEIGLLAGLWELPNYPGAMTRDEVCELLKKEGCHLVSLRTLKEAKHIFSHIEWHMSGYAAVLQEPMDQEGLRWATIQQLREQYPLPGAFKAFIPLIYYHLQGIDEGSPT